MKYRAFRVKTKRRCAMGDSPYGRILIPVDGSEDALRVIRPAGELARVMEASVDFLYVSPFDESTDEGDASWLPASIVRPAAEEAQEIFTVAESLLPQEVARACHHRAGIPAEEILRFIDVMGIRLVAISGHKHSRVSGLLLGSVMQTVLERAHACVLAVGND